MREDCCRGNKKSPRFCARTPGITVDRASSLLVCAAYVSIRRSSIVPPIRQEALCPVAKGRVITRRLVRRLGDTIAAPGFSLIGLRLTTSAPGCLRAIVEKWPREEETHKSPWEVADTLRTRRFVGLHAKTVVASLSLGRSSLRRSCWICRSPRETRGMKSTWVRRGWSHMDQ